MSTLEPLAQTLQYSLHLAFVFMVEYISVELGRQVAVSVSVNWVKRTFQLYDNYIYIDNYLYYPAMNAK